MALTSVNSQMWPSGSCRERLPSNHSFPFFSSLSFTNDVFTSLDAEYAKCFNCWKTVLSPGSQVSFESYLIFFFLKLVRTLGSGGFLCLFEAP